MEVKALQDLVERFVGSEDIALILSALERFEIQSEIPLSESRATHAIQRAIEFKSNGLSVYSRHDGSLSRRCELITEHLLRG